MCEVENNLSTFHKGQILTEGLILVREDICDWITTLFQDAVITGETFLSSMETGILLCDLLQRIYQHISPSRLPRHWPLKPPNADRRATPRSFKAWDNVSLFLKWCRDAGLRNTILFETKGLMNNDEEKNVVLTILHLGEICVDFDIPVPQFAKFKSEMDASKIGEGRNNSICVLTDLSDVCSTDSGFNSARSTSNLDTVDCSLKPSLTKRRQSESTTSSDKTFQVMSSQESRRPQTPVSRNNIRALKNNTKICSKSRATRSKSFGSLCTVTDCNRASSGDPGLSTVETKVREISKRCCCETKFQIERTTMHEGMYRIGSKNIFVRMFKENVMLRIGGGWETLNEYLDKVDPCCKNQARRKSTGNLLTTSISIDNMSPRELSSFSQTEFTKVKKLTPIRSVKSAK